MFILGEAPRAKLTPWTRLNNTKGGKDDSHHCLISTGKTELDWVKEWLEDGKLSLKDLQALCDPNSRDEDGKNPTEFVTVYINNIFS